MSESPISDVFTQFVRCVLHAVCIAFFRGLPFKNIFRHSRHISKDSVRFPVGALCLDAGLESLLEFSFELTLLHSTAGLDLLPPSWLLEPP